MAFLKFEALDQNGKVVSGTLQAGTPAELEIILGRQGLRAVSIDGNRLANAPAQVAQRTQMPRPTNVNPVATRKPQPAPVQAQPQAIPNNPQQSFVTPTPTLSIKNQIFFYSQCSSLFNSGVGGAQLFQTLGPQLPDKFHPMFKEMEQEISNGSTIADAMDKRPITFTPDVASTVRAGEMSGQLGVAFAHLSNTAARTKALNLPLYYFFFMFPLLLMCGIGGIGLQIASNSTIKRQDEAGGHLPPVGTLLEEMGSKGWPYFLAALATIFVFYAVVRTIYNYRFRRLRHDTGLKVGPKRARSEGLERFSWALSATTRAGISPASAVRTAAGSIPNMILREKALAAIGNVRENESLAQLLMRSGMLEQQQVYMIQNSEISGDVPGTLDSIMRSEEMNYEGHTSRLRLTTSAVTTIFMSLFTLVMVAYLFTMYASGLIKMILAQ